MLYDFKFWLKQDLPKKSLFVRELPEDASYRSYQGIRCCMSGSITTIAVTKLFTNHHHHQTRQPSSDFFSPISHQMSSRLLPLSYLSLRFRFREEPLRWDSVMCSADQIRFRYRSQFFFEIQIRDEILSATAIADVCRLRGRSIRRTKFSAAQALAGKVALGASRNGSCS